VEYLGRVPYREVFDLQKEVVARVQRRECDDTLILVEHPSVITVGRNATGAAITAGRGTIESRGVEVVETDRGGDVTYHGPGQLVCYPIVRLEGQRRDIRRYVHDLEEVLLAVLADFCLPGRRHDVHRGVWVGERKIASLGIRLSRWVTCHGFALNVDTDLSFFSLITPCGIAGCEMTTMTRELGRHLSMDDVAASAVAHFATVFEREMLNDTGTIAAGQHHA
jgi:lipoate-protein ligase B